MCVIFKIHINLFLGFLRNITGGSTGITASHSSPNAKTRTRTPSSIPSSSASKHAPVKRVAVSSNLNQNLSGSITQSEDSELNRTVSGPGERLSYLLLGQEEYLEHNSEVTQCKFSASGYNIASSDTDGVVKVWSAFPTPQTFATFGM